ncbi:WbqC family protein [Methylobacterium sp. NMS14P]|uniref:WbqC family protein n=1 Tax=Methylobacterium sp. NMS14P TaxID=2894310 RepID=UPI002359347D|nr:WbqC family protein [Methylobacterium sp. NMS14P]WCS26431.1 WbqC family protein [Methylobacterium sp. NMS14P]
MSAVFRVAIVQSSYVPWRGAFALMARCDQYVFLDSVQFTRRDWRTRNRIKTAQGPAWLTIPVKQKGNYHAPIDAIEIAEPGWAAQHLRRIEESYARAEGFGQAIGLVRDGYAAAGPEPMLSRVNQHLTQSIATALGLTTRFTADVDLIPREDLRAMDPTARLIALAAAAGATHYLSGPSARAYLDESAFAARGISVEWMSYDGLGAYPQLWGPFEPAVSILDPLLTLGPDGTRSALRVDAV